VASADGEETGTTGDFVIAQARAKTNDGHGDEKDAGRRVGADAEEATTEEGFDTAAAGAKTTDGDDDEAEAIHAARARLGEDKS
jgi:hypothetical protein